MRLAKNALLTALTMLALLVAVSAQTLRSEADPRNTAPTVGTGGPMGGPTGLFTVYDGQTLRRGEFTFSAAYSNFDRDPGNVDIVEMPISFQIGVSDHLELFFNTDAYRQIKVNSPQNLSSFYLPNSRINGINPAAIVAAPVGPGTSRFNGPVFRPAGTQPFVQYPYIGGPNGNYGMLPYPGNFQVGQFFGFAVGANPTIGTPVAGGNGADVFPGLGSIYGSILPGVVLSTEPTGGGATRPVVYTLQPSYLPDAPFINRTFGESSFNTFTIGGKIRFTGPNSPYGIGIIPFYRFYADNADDASGFNQMQRGSGPGSGGYNPFSNNRGDVGITLFADARLRKWVNLSGNVGYIKNSSVKADIGGTEYTLLDRPDEFQYAVAFDFPVNKFFQPILEFRRTYYIGGRTPNAFENSPMDGVAGFRVFPARWFGFGAAYRHHFNQQDRDSIEDVRFTQNVTNQRAVLDFRNNFFGFTQFNTTSSGFISQAFRTSSDPHGFILQVFAGHRNARLPEIPPNSLPTISAFTLDRTTVVLPCPPGTSSASGGCGDVQSVSVSTTATDLDNDVLTYSYTVTGGRIVGQGANVNWDLTGVRTGSYSITTTVDDGTGAGATTTATRTSTITVSDCPDCRQPAPICECPTLSVTGPSDTVAPGTSMTFTANVSGGNQPDVSYNWSVSTGTIESGQGTPSITVNTAGLESTEIVATVNISGTRAECNCITTAEGRGAVASRPVPTISSEIGTGTTPDEIKARVDAFFTALNNDPTARGVIINYGSDREVARREADIRKAIAFRNFPIDRVEFVRGSSVPGIRTEFYLVPAGAEPPVPRP